MPLSAVKNLFDKCKYTISIKFKLNKGKGESALFIR